MYHRFIPNKRLRNYSNLPTHYLLKTLDLPRYVKKDKAITYAKRHHIKLNTNIPVSECAMPKGMGMSMADLQDIVSMQGLPISDKYGLLSRFELCRLYQVPTSVSKISPASSSLSTNPVAKKIMVKARAAANAAHNAAKVAATVVSENPSDTAAQSASIAAQQLATVAQQAVDKVVALVETETKDAETVVKKLETVAQTAMALVVASAEEAIAHENPKEFCETYCVPNETQRSCFKRNSLIFHPDKSTGDADKFIHMKALYDGVPEEARTTLCSDYVVNGATASFSSASQNATTATLNVVKAEEKAQRALDDLTDVSSLSSTALTIFNPPVSDLELKGLRYKNKSRKRSNYKNKKYFSKKVSCKK